MNKSPLADKNPIFVYKATTKPKKPKRRDKSDLGPNFIAPDGGWGWVVCLAAGFSNFCMFPALQQYGLIYRERLAVLNFDAKETTTIVNVVMAISSLVGIVNGAMFRRFSFRQVALFGSMLVFVGLLSSAYCSTFLQYIVFFSFVYGIGLGLTMAATSLAVNTYFKLRRRRATGFAWTITGLGPIIFPYISTQLLSYYGVVGTILLFSGIALHSVACALTLQPVLWHARKPNKVVANVADTNLDNGTVALEEEHETQGTLLGDTHADNDHEDALDDYECKYCQYMKGKKRGIFSSQYLFNNDDPERPGYEITEPGTPMMARANDGWYGSKLSLTPDHGARFRKQQMRRQNSGRSRENINLEGGGGVRDDENEAPQLYRPNYFNREREDLERYASKMSVQSRNGAAAAANELRCTCAEEKGLVVKSGEELRQEKTALRAAKEADEEVKRKMTLRQKIVKFFDLDLLRDFTFVNLALGMTIMMFGEMNFSVLTPFILNDFGYSDDQISLAMSLLGGIDISVRFLAPFALEKVKLDNRVLFAFGIMAIALGRYIVTLTRSFNVVLAVFVLIGFGKGFRTIFAPLIIPSYVPLNRLPAASGLQLISNTIFSFACTPILGMLTDAFSYKMTIHFINGLTCLALFLWLLESLVRRLIGKPPTGISE